MRRPLISLGLGLVVSFAAIITVYLYLAGDQRGAELVLTEISGQVALSGNNGMREAKAGAVITRSDRIATGPDGRAVLGLHDSHIRIGPSSTVEVREVTPDRVRLELEGGVLKATVRPSAAVRVGSRGREVVSTAGAFEVGVDGELMQIEVEEGNLVAVGFPDLSSVRKGERIRVHAEGHTEIGTIDQDLLLNVNWPEPGNQPSVWFEGKTDPFLQVLVRLGGGVLGSVRADAEGRFRVRVALQEGAHDYDVVAVDPTGTVREVTGLVRLDSKGPIFRGGAQYRPKRGKRKRQR